MPFFDFRLARKRLREMHCCFKLIAQVAAHTMDGLHGRTPQISDRAQRTQKMKQKRHRPVRCIWLVRRRGQ